MNESDVINKYLDIKRQSENIGLKMSVRQGNGFTLTLPFSGDIDFGNLREVDVFVAGFAFGDFHATKKRTGVET